MPIAFIPAPLRTLTGGLTSVEVPGQTVRQVVAALDERFPGVAAKLVRDDALSPGLAVSIDGTMTNRGLAARVAETSEVHFLPAIGGG